MKFEWKCKIWKWRKKCFPSLLFNQRTWWLLSYPETGQQSPLKGVLDLLQQSDLLPALVTLLSLLHLFNCVKIDDTSWMVKVNPDGGALGNVPDFCVDAIEPQLVVGSTPPKTPWLLVFSQPAGSVASPPPCPFKGDSDNHPSWIFNFPVGAEAQDTFFAKNLEWREKEKNSWTQRNKHNIQISDCCIKFTWGTCSYLSGLSRTGQVTSSVLRDTLDPPCVIHSILLAVLSSRESLIQSVGCGENAPITSRTGSCRNHSWKSVKWLFLHFRRSALHVGSGMFGS